MPIRVKIAKRPAELRELFRVRHRIFVEERGTLEAHGGSVVDAFDAMPTSVNFIALEDHHIIGGVRLTQDSEVGVPADASFDFRPQLPEDGKLIACSLLCLDSAHDANARLLTGMLMMGAYWAHSKDATHLCAPVEGLLRPMLEKLGFNVAGSSYKDNTGIRVIPMVLDLASMHDAFMDFVRAQHIGVWLENFEREFYAQGEPIIKKGEHGTAAYVVVSGDVSVLASHRESGVSIVATIPPGQLFGELALLADSERSATVIASSDAELMVLDRETFQRQIEGSPEIALAMLRTLGARFHDTMMNFGTQ